MKIPFITVIIPTIGRWEYVSDLLVTISNTQNSKIHLIIIDDSGKDICPNLKINEHVITKFDFIKTGKIGKNNAVCKGLKYVITEYFVIINDKDKVLKCLTEVIHKNKLKDEIGYVLGIHLKQKKNRQPRFNKFSSTLIDSYRKRKIFGDKVIIFKSEESIKLFKESILNECYFPEDIVHLKALEKKLNYLFIDNDIIERIYLKGGITDSHDKLISESFNSYNYYSNLTKISQDSMFDFRSFKIIIREKILFLNKVNSHYTYIVVEIATLITALFIILFKNFKKN